MKKIKNALLAVLLMGSWNPSTVLSTTVTVINSIGERAHLDVSVSDRFLDVLDKIESFYDTCDFELQAFQETNDYPLSAEGLSQSGLRYDFEVSHAGITVRSKKTVWRDFSVSVSKQEKQEITYIITTLANDSLVSIGMSKSSLKKTGDRIDHIHPLRFLMTVFTNEKLKAGIHAIRDRGGWIWDGFIDGLTGSMKEESGRGNLLPFIADFARAIAIDPSLIQSSMERGKWTESVNLLIDHIPRAIDPNRYDM